MICLFRSSLCLVLCSVPWPDPLTVCTCTLGLSSQKIGPKNFYDNFCYHITVSFVLNVNLSLEGFVTNHYSTCNDSWKPIFPCVYS